MDTFAAESREAPEGSCGLSGMTWVGSTGQTKSSEWPWTKEPEEVSNKWAALENAVLFASLKNGFLHPVGKIRLISCFCLFQL